MTENEKAKILLSGSLLDYVSKILKEKKYDTFTIHKLAKDYAYSHYEEAEIRDEWDEDTTGGFIEDGYSIDETIHDSWRDAIDECEEDLFLKEADFLVEKYFNNDKDFLQPVVDYLFE